MCGQAIDKFEEAVKLKRGQIIQSAMGEEWRWADEDATAITAFHNNFQFFLI